MLEWTYSPGLFVTGLLFIAALALVAAFYISAQKRVNGWRLMALILLRLSLVSAILICLLDPHWVQEIRVADVSPQAQTHLLVLVDTTRSMLESDGQFTRLEQAQHWWRSQKQPGSPPQLRGFDEGLHGLSNDETWTATQGGTSLAKTLKSVSAKLLETPVDGIILVSDGRITDNDSPESAALDLAAQGIGISTLTIGQDNPKPFLEIQSVDIPLPVRANVSVKAAVTFQSSNVTGQSGILRLTSGDNQLDEKKVTFTGEKQTVNMTFSLPPEPDLQICQAELELTPSVPRFSPKILPFAIRIYDPKIRVLYMEGSAVYEMLYLQRALQHNPNIKVKLLHRGTTPGESPDIMQTTVNIDDQSLVYDVMHPTEGYPKTLNEMLKYDVIINSDIPRECFTQDQLIMTEKFVEEYGGGFAMVGGNTAFGHGGYNYTPIDKIIPVAMENETAECNKPFKLVASSDALNHPIMKLGADAEETQRIWRDKNPILYGYDLVDRAKPGAVVLATASNNSNLNGPYVILAAQEVGNGRTMADTSDTTRNWGVDFETTWGEAINPQLPISEENCDTVYYRKFWNNAIQWLSAKSVARKNNLMLIQTSKREISPGEAFTIQVHLKLSVSDHGDPTHPALVHLQITNLDTNNVVQKVELPLKTSTIDYECPLHLADPGRYLIDAIDAGENGLTCAPAIITCRKVDPELEDTRPDPALMAKLAEITHGQVLSATSAEGLLSASRVDTTSGHIEYVLTSLWDQSWVLTALASLLIGEWVMRRRWFLV